MIGPAPPIDKRSVGALVSQTERLLGRYSPWSPTGGGLEPGKALVRIFARLVEVVVTRLNQVPDKNFLAFLNLIGLDLLPPQPARVPLTFHLAAGSATDALVPVRTQVAAVQAEGESEPIVFETEQDLVVTRSQLTYAFTREPFNDRYSDNTAAATGQDARAFSAFLGRRPIQHLLYVGDPCFGIDAPKTVTLRFELGEGDESWLSAVDWAYADGKGWTKAPTTRQKVGNSWEVTVPQLPAVPVTMVEGRPAAWLRAQLKTSLPHQLVEEGKLVPLHEEDLLPDAAFADSTPVNLLVPFFPFGHVPFPLGQTFYLASEGVFSKSDALVRIGVHLPSGRLQSNIPRMVICEYWNGTWRELGRSSPVSEAESSFHEFKDATKAFTLTGDISFRVPTDWAVITVNEVPHFWLRIRNVLRPGALPIPPFLLFLESPPLVERLRLSYAWQSVPVETDKRRIIKRADLTPEKLFANDTELVPARFFPLGEAPAVGARFYLASDEAFSKPGAELTISIDVDPTITEDSSSDKLRLLWEYGKGESGDAEGGEWKTEWGVLGVSSPTTSEDPESPYGFSDSSRAFTRSGIVRFRCPDTWAKTHGPKTSDVETFWIRTRINSGGYGPSTEPRPPKINRLVLGYQWPLPRVSALQSKVSITRSGLALDRALSNQVPVDPTKDFFPFGEKPKFNDTCYLACDEAFSKAGSDITINVRPSDIPIRPDSSREIQLTWEYWNGLAWRRIGVSSNQKVSVNNLKDYESKFSDETKAFTTFRTGPTPVEFQGPDDWHQSEINGQRAYWLRVRITLGGYARYGGEGHFEKVLDSSGNVVKDLISGAEVYKLVPSDFQPPAIKPLAIDYRHHLQFAKPRLLLSDNDFVIADYGEGWKKLFHPFTPSNDGESTLYLGFLRPGDTSGFGNRPTALYFGVVETPYGESVGAPSPVLWEYWNGQQWARLGVRDETQGLTRRGLVTFIGPPDFTVSTQFRQSAFWLRGRSGRGEGASWPQLRRVLLNTVWAFHTLTITNEVLGSSTGRPQQVFHTSRTPVLLGQRIEVREQELPSLADRTIVEDEEGPDAITAVLESAGQTAEIWVRWHEVPDFYESGPHSRHYVLDRLAGEIRFGDDRRGMAPPQGRGNVRAAVYQTGGGAQGNKPPASCSQLKSAVPYVGAVTNWEAAGGGAAAETPEELKERGPQTLRHRGRAVATADFEDLAQLASTSVARVKAIPAGGRAQAGSVDLIIVPRSADPQPIPSLELLARVHDYLAARLAPAVDLRVVGPDWVRVTVTAEIVPLSLEAATNIRTAVLTQVSDFLHPLSGGPQGRGWAFGRKPHRSEFFALIERIPGVDHVRALTVTEDKIASPGRFLIFSGDHQIRMVGE